MSEYKALIQDYRDTLSYSQMISKYGLSKMPPLIISCAITGAVQGKEVNPNLPESAEEQAQQAYDAWNAGASMIHIHRRDPNNPVAMTQRYEDYLEINRMVRERCPDVIVNNTCAGLRRAVPGANEEYTVGEQQLTSMDALPEVASVDLAVQCADLMLAPRKPPLFGRDEPVHRREASFMDYADLDNVIQAMRQRGIKPEYECFNLDGYKYLTYLEGKGLLDTPFWVQMIFSGSGATPVMQQMMLATRLLPANGMLSVIGIGAAQTALLTQAMILGHHVRVGLEDNYYYAPHELARDNAQMVERIVRIARELGREVATPEQAREMLGLGSARSYGSAS